MANEKDVDDDLQEPASSSTEPTPDDGSSKVKASGVPDQSADVSPSSSDTAPTEDVTKSLSEEAQDSSIAAAATNSPSNDANMTIRVENQGPTEPPAGAGAEAAFPGGSNITEILSESSETATEEESDDVTNPTAEPTAEDDSSKLSSDEVSNSEDPTGPIKLDSLQEPGAEVTSPLGSDHTPPAESGKLDLGQDDAHASKATTEADATTEVVTSRINPTPSAESTTEVFTGTPAKPSTATSSPQTDASKAGVSDHDNQSSTPAPSASTPPTSAPPPGTEASDAGETTEVITQRVDATSTPSPNADAVPDTPNVSTPDTPTADAPTTATSTPNTPTADAPTTATSTPDTPTADAPTTATSTPDADATTEVITPETASAKPSEPTTSNDPSSATPTITAPKSGDTKVPDVTATTPTAAAAARPAPTQVAPTQVLPTKPAPGNQGVPPVTNPAQQASASSAKPPKGGRGKRLLLLAAVPVILIAAFFGAWALDTNSRGESVSRNTEINGVDISGLQGEALEAAVTKSTDGILDQEIDVVANGDSVQTTPRELGASTDIDGTVEAALESRRKGFVLTRPFSWASSFLRVDQVEPQFTVDTDSLTGGIPPVLETLVDPVVETSIEPDGDGFKVVAGEEGETIDRQEIESELPEALGDDQPVLELSPEIGQPEITAEQATSAADDATAALDESLDVQLLDKFETVEPEVLREMVILKSSDGNVTWAFDNDVAVDELKKVFTDIGTDGDEARFTVINDTPIVLPVKSAIECCDETTAERLMEGIEDRPDDGESIRLEPEYTSEDPTADKLNEMGIVEEVSSFTTPHAANQNRVKNIQRFADLMRGQTIDVGEVQSLNDTVGERTLEKGFFADGAINQGVVEDQVGGGISQFATTYFNAAFFSGIEIQEHQFHTLAIGSRYPLGRESTIDFPSVDVQVKNTSEHAILVWTSYTPTSITVTFYSVKHLTVTDVNGQELAYDVYAPGGRDKTFPPAISSDRQCSVYTTTRNTEFPDGEVVQDSFSGFYRPGPGRDCNGDLTPKAQAELDKKNAEAE